jgi:VanZ family protein
MASTISRLHRVAAWLSVLALAVASWTPGQHMVRTSAPGDLEHVAAYLISALIWVTAYPRLSPWLIGGALAIWAGVLEIGQIYVPGRHSQFEGFAASCLGVALVVLPTLWIRPASSTRTG